METKKPTLCILNITSWIGTCAGAKHLFGKLIITDNENINIDNVEEYNVKYLGDDVELFREITLDYAKQLDTKDGIVHNGYQRKFRRGDRTSNRFDTFEQVVNCGIEKWKELNLDCPFITLYENEKYYKNSYSDDETVILYKNEQL